MTPDEIKKRLESLGVDTGKWTKTSESQGEIKLVQEQKQQLLAIQNMLKALARKDRDMSLQLQERLNKLKYGGGS